MCGNIVDLEKDNTVFDELFGYLVIIRNPWSLSNNKSLYVLKLLQVLSKLVYRHEQCALLQIEFSKG
jgi:hypothetical protein